MPHENGPHDPLGARNRLIAVLQRRLVDCVQVTRFYSRLPVPDLSWDDAPHALPDFDKVVWAVPVVGAILGGIGALIGVGAILIGIAPLPAAALAIATLVIITGCFHEDGLADSCDGLWGGVTPERRLTIMKDSRIGSYGAAGLCLALLLRVAALAELFRLFGPMAGVLLPGIGAASRVLSLTPTLALPPAQPEGLAGRTHMPGPLAFAWAVVLGCLVLAASMLPLGLLAFLPFISLALAPVLWLSISLARARIGGFTGDILGATQQVLEITLLLGLGAAGAATGPL